VVEDFESSSHCEMGKLRITNAICFPSRLMGQRRLGFGNGWELGEEGLLYLILHALRHWSWRD